jgi:uncharacterized protein (DUF58 family)
MSGVRQVILRRRVRSENRRGGGVREYRAGEEARSIHWRASASTGSIQIFERERDPSLTWAAIVDASLSMEAGRKRSLSAAASEAAAFWRACAAPGDRWVDVDSAGRFGFAAALERALRVLPANGTLLAASDFFDLPQVPAALLRSAARCFDCTALVARDPWREDLPLAGFVCVADLETRVTRKIFVGSRERRNFIRRAYARERNALAAFRRSGWRAGLFDESDGARAVMRTFGAA